MRSRVSVRGPQRFATVRIVVVDGVVAVWLLMSSTIAIIHHSHRWHTSCENGARRPKTHGAMHAPRRSTIQLIEWCVWSALLCAYCTLNNLVRPSAQCVHLRAPMMCGFGFVFFCLLFCICQIVYNLSISPHSLFLLLVLLMWHSVCVHLLCVHRAMSHRVYATLQPSATHLLP